MRIERDVRGACGALCKACDRRTGFPEATSGFYPADVIVCHVCGISWCETDPIEVAQAWYAAGREDDKDKDKHSGYLDTPEEAARRAELAEGMDRKPEEESGLFYPKEPCGGCNGKKLTCATCKGWGFLPNTAKDGNAWCAIVGNNLMEGVAGFGKTPEEARDAFYEAWTKRQLHAA